MKEIKFKPELVRAIHDGRKTQTRRPVKPQPTNSWAGPEIMQCPYGYPGDRLQVMEAGKGVVWGTGITLEITRVHVQRVQEISEADAEAEGVGLPCGYPIRPLETTPHRHEFRRVWDEIYNNWEANPWVWVIEFKEVASARAASPAEAGTQPQEKPRSLP